MSKVSRRNALIAMGAAAAALPVQAGIGKEGNVWAPTELGRNLMALLPAYVEAIYDDCNTCDVKWAPEYDRQRVEAVDRAYRAAFKNLEAAVEAIIDRPVTELAHLTDLAMVWAVWEERHEGDENKLQAAQALMHAILKLGGISPSECGIDDRYAAYKSVREASVVGGANA